MSEATGPFPGQIYWSDGDSVWAAGLDGSNPQALATGQSAWGLAVSPVVHVV